MKNTEAQLRLDNTKLQERVVDLYILLYEVSGDDQDLIDEAAELRGIDSVDLSVAYEYSKGQLDG